MFSDLSIWVVRSEEQNYKILFFRLIRNIEKFICVLQYSTYGYNVVNLSKNTTQNAIIHTDLQSKKITLPFYFHFKVYNASKLMEYCQGFLLQNMVALLTYDDSVKRLLFAKKIPNHDVLSGLLSTLQHRIKTRRTSQQNISQNLIKPVPIIPNSSGSSNMLNKSNNNLNGNLKME